MKILVTLLILAILGGGFLTKTHFDSGDQLVKINNFQAKSVAAASTIVAPDEEKAEYWFLLYRKSQVEKLFLGVPGNEGKSELVKTFKVKTGRVNERPTPLPQLIGREYWLVTAEEKTSNPDTAPYFLTLDIPYDNKYHGPMPYLECDGQCDWVTPGRFGLHGVGGVSQRLSTENPGSSGCIRHTDEEITYLYNLLDLNKSSVRYYIQDI